MQFNKQLIDLPNLHQAIDRYPLTISIDSYVVDAINLMNQEQLNSSELINFSTSSPGYTSSQKITSCVLVLKKTQLMGILTLRDVLRLTALHIDFSSVTMGEVMTPKPITLKQSEFQDISAALLLLKQYQIRHLPIVDDEEKLVGMVTESSLLAELELVKILGMTKATQQYLEKSDQLSGNSQKIEGVFPQAILPQLIDEKVGCEAIELERRRYQDLFEFTPYGYVVTNKLGLIEEVNRAASLLLSVNKNSLVGKEMATFINQSYRHITISQLSDLQHSHEWEIDIKPEQGLPFPANVKITPMYDSQNQWIGWCWFLCDITRRKQAEIALRQSSEQLEERVAERTAELVKMNQSLQAEIIERKQTEAALKQSEAKFRHFTENSQALIWMASKDGSETLYINPAYEKIWGRSCQSLREQPQSWREAIHPEDRDRILAEIEERHRQAEPASLQYRLVHPNGDIRWIWGRCFPIKNQQGELEYFGSITEDITEYKQVEAERIKTEERLTLALEAANMGIWDWHIQTNETLWSNNMGPIYGLPNHTLCPTPEDFLNFIYPEDRNNFTQAVKTAINEKVEFAIEYRVIWSDGSLHWLSTRGKVHYDSNDQPVRMLGTTKDISVQKQAEQKIHEQAALLNIATDAIFVRDFQTEILFWNQGAERIYGWQIDEAIGKNLKDIFYPTTSLQQEIVALQTVVKHGAWHGELHKKTKSGKEIIVESRWTLMFDTERQPKSILIVDTDITQKKELEEQFYRTQRLESIGTLAGGIAHDINNILTPILGAAQLLQGRFARQEERHTQLLAIIESNAKRGASLVKQVLSFARGLKGERGIVQVKHIIADIIQIGKQTFPKSIEFTAQIPEDLWAISGDTTQLHQVLMNLVVNARDAMPEGGNLQITANNLFIDQTYVQMHLEAQVGHYIVITVADTGMGMKPETLDRIFEPFFTTKEVAAGTGLGLSTVLGIIKSHDGFVRVSSEVGQGSTFQVFLPSVEVPQIPTIKDLEMTLGGGELILVVDDEPQIRDVAKIILEQYNYQTITAKNGIEAIALYAQHKKNISAVLMDMMMPGMDGITAIRTLQKINPQVQVIACSGLNTIEILPESANTKVQAVLLKPYTANELLRNLNQIIHSS